MALSDNLENMIARVIERALTARYSEQHALVTSYDPDTYLAKVKFQPYGQLSGWLPIETGHIGSTYGIAIGLQPGSGDAMGGGNDMGSQGEIGANGSRMTQQSQDSLGDQVIVRFQGDDFEAGKIVQRVHSKKDKPPKSIQSGEMMTWTKFKKDQDSGPDAQKDGTGGTGCKVYHKNDGSLLIEDGNGASRIMDGNGNQTVTSGNKQKTTKILHQIVQDNPGLSDTQQQQQQQKPIHYSQLEKQKGARTSVFQEQHYTNWDQSGVTHSSTQNVTMQANNQVVSQAPQIPHIGNSSVTQVLTVGIQTNSPIYTNASDRRIKHDIQPASPVLKKIMALEVKEFMEDHLSVDASGRHCIADGNHRTRMHGFIAQDVRAILPDMVFGDEATEFLSVSENKIGVLLVQAFQEFVRETRKEIAELKAQLDARPVA